MKKIIIGVTILIQAAFIVAGLLLKRHWFIPDNILIIGVAILLYIFWDKFYLTAWHLVALNIFFIMHAFGFIDAYALTPFGIPYDKILHFSAPFIFSSILMRAWTKNTHFSSIVFRGIVVVLVVLGVGAILEIVEYGGYTFLGEGDGIFFFGVGDGGKLVNSWQDSMTDLLADLMGGISAALITGYYYRQKPK